MPVLDWLRNGLTGRNLWIVAGAASGIVLCGLAFAAMLMLAPKPKPAPAKPSDVPADIMPLPNRAPDGVEPPGRVPSSSSGRIAPQPPQSPPQTLASLSPEIFVPPSVEVPPVATVPPVADPATMPSWERYARRVPAGSGPRIAIVIDDAGLDHARTARAIALPGPLTIAFLTYGEGLEAQVRAARDAGHELMAHVAMQPSGHGLDPGPDVLLRDTEPDEILTRLRRVLGRFDGYVGINNHMGSLFTADPHGMRIVLQEIERRGLLFLDSRTSSESVGWRLAREMGVPSAQRDVFLDNEPVESAVVKQLDELEQIARKRGAAVAIGHPRDGTLDALARWIPEARARGIVLVPISAIAKQNEAKRAVAARP